MTVINTNIGALNAHESGRKANLALEKSFERLSSGKRINRASDDAAGLAVSSKMIKLIKGMNRAVLNTQDGISLVQTAESSIKEINNMLFRIRELAVQMATGTYSGKDRDYAQLEVEQLLEQIDKISDNAKFNNVTLLDGAYIKDIRSGDSNKEIIPLYIKSTHTTKLGRIEAFSKEVAVDGGSDTSLNNQINVKEGTIVEIDTSVFSNDFKDFLKEDHLGTFSLAAPVNGTVAVLDADDDNDSFQINAKTGVITSKFQMDFEDTGLAKDDNGDGNLNDATQVGGVIGESVAGTKVFQIQVTYTRRDGATHTENLKLNLTNVDESQLDDVDVSSQASATRAVETLDKVINEISERQARLGALQNRMTHAINYLSSASMYTEFTVGRIMDADYSKESTQLAKQQILAQVATAMLAQANNSTQTVLTLLQ